MKWSVPPTSNAKIFERGSSCSACSKVARAWSHFPCRRSTDAITQSSWLLFGCRSRAARNCQRPLVIEMPPIVEVPSCDASLRELGAQREGAIGGPASQLELPAGAIEKVVEHAAGLCELGVRQRKLRVQLDRALVHLDRSPRPCFDQELPGVRIPAQIVIVGLQALRRSGVGCRLLGEEQTHIER